MTEASLTQRLLTTLKQRMPGADIWKIADRSTIGRPDIAVTWKGRTWWLEVKLLRKGDSLAKCSPEIQRFTMVRLQLTSGGRALYVVYDARKPTQRVTQVYAPTMLREDAPLMMVGGFDHDQVARFLEDA